VENFYPGSGVKRGPPDQNNYARHAASRQAIFGGRTGLGFGMHGLEERVQMNGKDIADWTDAIEKEE